MYVRSDESSLGNDPIPDCFCLYWWNRLGLLENFYTINEATVTFSWLGSIAILLLFFVYYRNKLHYISKGRNKLPKKPPLLSLMLVILPYILE
ncbi:hypothetical protein J2S17_004397 [Cytobacillus purgationiresistens]|uniref:Uncharacterized protein n=1 Tax=Cytobacillus purgationiresistens TaxID=863449 RepID=A0ABU0AN88_9BACI|nr:hypothetical protein [Cytobacillus purgationiresistens]